MDIFEFLSGDAEGNSKSPIEPKDLIQDGHLHIPPYLWSHLNERYSEKEIKELLNRAVEDYSLPFPYKEISSEMAWSDYEKLRFVDSPSQFSFVEWDSKKVRSPSWKNYIYQGNPVLLRRNTVGLKASDFFQQTVRMKCGHERYVSPWRMWTERRSRTSMWGPLWSLGGFKGINKNVCGSLIRARGYLASQFRPASAKAIYDIFGGERVLDFSSGWRDRLAGFYASNAKEYVGIDPNSALHSGYQNQVDFYGGQKKTTFFCQPAESIDLSEFGEYFDLVFTSPPYFFTERYCEEDTQSWKRYGKNLSSWLSSFLYPSLTTCWNSLRVGGRLIVNIADVLSQQRYYKLCHPMNEFISQLPDAKYEGVIGYELAKRYGSNHDVSSLDENLVSEANKTAEPMWVWSKGTAQPVSFVEKEFWEE